MPKKKRKTVGLALGGGAIRGIAHVSIIESLLNAGIPIDMIAGTSAGAWVGAAYAVFPDIEKIKQMTIGDRNERLLALFKVNRFRIVKKADKMDDIFTEIFNHKSFSDTKIPLSVTAVDIENGSLEVLNKGNLATAVRASMTLPGVFPPLERDGKILVDGGVINPVPADICRDMGADVVIAINLDGHLTKPAHIPEKSIRSPIKVGVRTTEIMRAEMLKKHISKADITITPDFPYVGIEAWKSYFVDKKEKEYLDIGTRAAEAALPEIKTLLS